MKALLPLIALLCAAPAAAQKTVWLVRPLYPGQEALVGRTEQALEKLTPAEQRPFNIIGHKELAAALKGKKVDELPCFGDSRCLDPVDPFVAGLGFDRFVLVQGGQDEAGFKFKVVSYEPAAGRANPASATDSILENALLGAVAKVVPVASTLEVKTSPAGAIVYVDEKKAGITPLSTQVLPGERQVRLDLKMHQPSDETVVVPIKGTVKLEKTLQKVAARLSITASPTGTVITIDDKVAGTDRVDRGIEPGTHSIRLTADNHKTFEQTVEVRAEEQFTLSKSLEPLSGAPRPGEAMVMREQVPLTLAEQIYEKKTYVYIGFNYDSLNGGGFISRRFGDNGNARTLRIGGSNRQLFGANAEFGFFGKYFGMAAIGADVSVNDGTWRMDVGRRAGDLDTTFSNATCPTGEDQSEGNCRDTQISARVILATIRAVQPQIRFQLWRFMLGLQAGFELRVGALTQTNMPIQYNDGFLVFHALAALRANVRFYIYEGLFAYGQYRFSVLLTGWDPTAIDPATGATVRNDSFANGFTGGIGYAF